MRPAKGNSFSGCKSEARQEHKIMKVKTTTNTAKNLKALRENNGISRAKISRQTGRSLPTVMKWETGEAEPSSSDILILSEMFGVTTDFLIKGNAEEVYIKQQKFANDAIKKASEAFSEKAEK